MRRLTGYEPFSLPCLRLGSGASIAIGGGGSEIYFHPTSAHIFQNTLIPNIGLIDRLLFYFINSRTTLRRN
jgi:hypothetical protein